MTLVRPEFNKLSGQLREGDVVTVWRVDRLGRTTLELIKIMVELREKGVECKSLTEGIDTTTAMGRMWFMLSAIFSENEREILRERSRAGLQAARARGRVEEGQRGNPQRLKEKPSLQLAYTGMEKV